MGEDGDRKLRRGPNVNEAIPAKHFSFGKYSEMILSIQYGLCVLIYYSNIVVMV